MTARYGDRTRVGQQVSSWGKDVDAAGDAKEPYEEIFTAPGTWTWPGNVDTVEVTVVGGGGGGGASDATPPTILAGGGGGGGVRSEFVAISAPVPVVIGAGGSGGVLSPTITLAQIGGSSSFGPISVGGGGAGAMQFPSPILVNAPPDGGGGGGGGRRTPGGAMTRGAGGLYGYSGGSSVAPIQIGSGGGGAGSAGSSRGRFQGTGGENVDLYGAGGAGAVNIIRPLFNTSPLTSGSGHSVWSGGGRMAAPRATGGPLGPLLPPDGFAAIAESGRANSGGGGGAGRAQPAPDAPSLGPLRDGGSGGSGVVIVRWWE